jgi:hypothetical protein
VADEFEKQILGRTSVHQPFDKKHEKTIDKDSIFLYIIVGSCSQTLDSDLNFPEPKSQFLKSSQF